MSTPRFALALLFLLPAATARSVPAAEPQPVLVRAFDSSAKTTRAWFVGESATVEDAVELRLRLIDAGARNVNLFLPDRVIVCDVPDHLEVPVDLPAGFSRAGDAEIGSQPAMMFRPWSWIIGAYDHADASAFSMGGAGADI